MAVIKLVGPVTTARGSLAVFSVALDDDPVANTLAPNEFIDITLDSAGGTASEGSDFARLLAADLNGADPSKISLSEFSTNPTTGAVSLRITNIGTTDLQRGTTLLSFALATREDANTATNYNVSLSASNPADSVSGAATITTTIEAVSSRILNWGRSVGNRTIDTTGTFLVPETDAERFARTGLSLPSNLAGKNDYGLGFNFTIDATTGDGTFLLDNDGLKISSGPHAYTPATITTRAGQFEVGGKYTISSVGGTDFTLIGAPNNNIGTTFIATSNGGNNGTGTATSDGSDYLYAIGYPPGVLTSGVYINALDLSTLRLGNGNDIFSVIGTGITQAVRAEVSIDSSFGYIFQSSIFAGSGDDTLRVLMPWQSTFKGGTNTIYYDAIFGSNPGNGIGVTLSNSLTLEEVPYGDLIELKGSRFDWDIEFKDGNGDGNVTLESILDERDYLAVANNNQISGFERILFGDILFDLVLYRQQQSSVVYGQPEYYLNGQENLAPELNSDIASGSKLWEAFRFNRTKLQGITGTATDQTDVFTGDTNDTPFIVGALRFASLNTEAGNDIVEIGTAGQTAVDQASIDLGSGTDQLKVNGLFTRSSVEGGDGADNIILTTVSNATVNGDTGDDVVEITTSVSQTVFIGGDGNDVLILPGTYASYLLTSSVASGVITFSDGFGNSITGFETLKFSDINLDALQQLSLTGSATVDEGSTATYTVSLNGGGGLLAGESVAFSLQLNGSGSNPTNVFTDLAALVTSSLQASDGIVLKNISVDTNTGLIRAVATAATNLNPGTGIATLSIPVNADLLTESAETFLVTLRDFGSLVPSTQQFTTTITDVPPVTIRLVGPSAAVTEGSPANYKVLLDAAGLALAVGRSVSFTLDSASGTATEGSDFVALSAGVLTPNSIAGVTLTTSSGPNGSITVTATNNGVATLAAGEELLSFAVETNTDTLAESSESFSVTLSSSSAVISSGAAVVNTTIADQVPAIQIRLDPSPTTSVIEGSTASFLVSLDGTPLKAGEQVRLRLDTDSGSGANPAKEGTDFAALIAAGLTPVNGISLSAISTSRNGAVTLTATNTGGFDLPNDSQLLSFNVTTSNDVAVEGDETFHVTLSGVSPSAATTGANAATVTITDNDTAAIKLTGTSTVAEGGSASYAVSLDGVGLGAGQSLTFTLDSSGLTATQGAAFDFAELLVSNAGAGLSAAPGITFSSISTNAITGAVTLTATNSGTSDLAAGAQLLSFSLATTSDTLPEINETFSVSLSSSSATVTAGSVTTTITDDDPLSVRLSGPATVAEGASATPYTVALGAGVGLGVGRSVTFTLDSASGTATEGVDFAALLAGGITAASGLTLTPPSTGAGGVLTVTLTNNTVADLAAGSDLVTFAVQTTADLFNEDDETYGVTIAGGAGVSVSGAATVTTTITDNDPATIKLTGAASVAEGSTATYAVSLDGVGLGAGRSLTFSLDTTSGTATEGLDFAALLGTGLTAATGITLSGITTAANGTVTLTATNTSGADLAANTQLLTFAVAASTDAIAEVNETYTVSLASGTATVSTGTVTTSINSVGGLITTNTSTSTAQWRELNGFTIFGIAGTEVAPITVNTGSGDDLVILDDAIAFATVDTGPGNDSIDGLLFRSGDELTRPYVQFGQGAYKAKILTGDGNDRINIQSAANTNYVRATPQDIPSYNQPDYYDSVVDAGDGNDYVYGFLPYKTQFLGGAGVDSLFFYGRYSDWTYQTVDDNGGGLDLALSDNANDYTIWNVSPSISNTAIENRVQGFEFIQFNDINLDLRENLLLSATAAAYAEGSTATYTIALASNGLQTGQSVAFTLQLSNGTAQFTSDLATLALSSLQASAGIVLSNVTVDATAGSIRAVASSTSALATGSTIATLSLPIKADLLVEGNETFGVTLSGFVTPQTVNTTITDANAATIKLTGVPTVAEGSSANYSVSLDGLGLGAGRGVTFSIDTASNSATEGSDFNALLATGLTAASGITLSGITTAPDGTVTLTATNSGATDLASSQLLSFAVQTTQDAFNEADETFGVTIAAGAGVSVSGAPTVTTTITDDDPLSVRLSGPATVAEGASATPYTVALGAGVGLGVGRSVTFTLDSASGTATEGVDFAALLAGGITAASGLTLTPPTTGAGGVLTVTLTNNTAADLAAGADLVTFAVQTTADLLNEADETYGVTIAGGAGVSVSGAATVTTTITDNDALSVRLSGPATVVEGASATPYTVALGAGVGLGVGRSVTFTLDSASGTATEGVDFAALLAGGITAANGLTLTSPTTGAGGVISVTLTNNTAADLAAGADLVTFAVQTTADLFNEDDETYGVTIAGGAGVSVSGAATVTTTITDNDALSVRLSGPATVVEGASATPYTVALGAGVGLGVGRSVTFTLDSASGTATEGVDFAALLAGGITAASGLTLTPPSTGAGGVLTVTLTNNTVADLAAGADLVTFAVQTTQDAFNEADETYGVTIAGGAGVSVSGAATVTTSITNDDPLSVRLSGPATVVEGASATPYTVALGAGVGLGVGRSVTFTLDSASGTATEGVDFAALLAGGITAASGLTLTPPTTGAGGVLTVTLTNNTAADLAAGADLVTFAVQTTADLLNEADETYGVTIAGGAGVSVSGAATVTTTITDNDPAAIRLTGSSSVAEGATASYAIELDGVGLGAGRSIAISLFTSKTGTATESSDFAKFLASALTPAAGISLTGVSTDTAGIVSATVTSTSDLGVGAPLLTFSLATLGDAVAELAETFELNLISAGPQSAAVRIAALQTTITDSTAPVITLTGPAAVTEGSPAVYGVALDGVALGGGRSVTFTLDSQGFGDLAGLSATQGKDLSALVTANLKATPLGLTLSAISTDPTTGAITLTATNTLPIDLAAGSQLVSFELPTSNDVFVEGDETFRVSLASSSATVTGGVITTTISDNDAPVIKLTGSDTVAEGATASYAVSLDGVGLGAGAGVTFSLDTASLAGASSATEGTDLAALVFGSLTAAAGLTLTNLGTAPNGAVTVRASNTSGSDLAAGARLLDIAIPTLTDVLVEANEGFSLNLTSSSATVSAGTVTTTITDDDIPLISLSGPASVNEGASASYTVALSGIGLGAGRSLSFSLDTASGSGATAAAEGSDFAALLAASLTYAAGISPSGISTAADGVVTLTVTNTSGGDLGAGSPLLSFAVGTTQDAITEANETFSVSLGGSNGTATVSTTITDNDPAALRLSGAASVLEGASASYAVALDGVGLGAGRSVTFTLDSSGISATEGIDFAALVAGSLTAATGVTLSGLSSGANGAITLTATNTGGKDLDVGAQLLSFAIAASTDAGAETDEGFEVSLSSSGASVASGAGLVSTTIENIGGLISQITTRGTGSLTPAQWLELNGETPGAPPFTGLAGAEDATITVNTGDSANSVRLSDAIAFATLNTGAGNDQVLVAFSGSRDLPYVQFGHGAYKATINTGDGNDVINIQSAANSAYVRSTPQDPPSYTLPDYYDSIVDAGGDDDYVYGFLPYKTQFRGGTGTDTLFLYGRYSDWSVQTVDVAADGLILSDLSSDYTLWSAATSLSSTAIDNAVRGFEFIQFNDINLDLVEQLTLSGPASIAEGGNATFSVGLATAGNGGNGLAAGQSVAFSLRLSGGTASLSSDLAALAAASLQAAAGISLQNVVVDASSGLIRAVASATKTFNPGASIASLVLPISTDLLVEGPETFSLTLGGLLQPQTVTTAITDGNTAAIKLSGSSSVTEGSAASYSVALDGVGLGAGRSLTFTLDSSGLTATEGTDFAALLAGSLTLASAQLALTTSAGTNGAINVTVTNNGTDLAANSQLLSFSLAATSDSLPEINETFSVSLTGSTGSNPTTVAAGAGLVTTTIADEKATANVPENGAPLINLSGSASVSEGDPASYTVALSGTGLGAGRSLSFSLDTASGAGASGAKEGLDFAALVASSLIAADGVSLSSTTGANGVLNVTVASASDLPAGSALLRFAIGTIQDLIPEVDETYSVVLGGSIGTASLATTISDNDQATLRLSGGSSVGEGGSASYTVTLGGAGLGADRSVSFILDAESGTATEEIDFTALLVSGGLIAGQGITLNSISVDPLSKAATVTASNTSGSDIAAGSEIVSFSVSTIADSNIEGTESFAVRLSSSSATIASDGSAVLTEVSDSSNQVSLRSTPLGYQLQPAGGQPVRVTFNDGQFASDSNPGGGWRATAAFVKGSGYELYWRNSNTSEVSRWNLNSSGALTSSQLLANSELLAAETSLNSDLDGNGSIGLASEEQKGTDLADDVIGLDSDDILEGLGGDDKIDGGPGFDTAKFDLAPDELIIRATGQPGVYSISSALGTDIITGIEQILTKDGSFLIGDSGSGLFSMNRGGENILLTGTIYQGPVATLERQLLGTTADEIIGGTTLNDFLNLLGGDDAADAGIGDDVLDGGAGSNFLTGGRGKDVFFLDGRAGTVTWSTITDWEQGEQLSVWGWKPGVSKATFVQSDGAQGFKGVTMHGDLNGDGTIDTSVTWANRSQSMIPTPLEFDGLLWFT